MGRRWQGGLAVALMLLTLACGSTAGTSGGGTAATTVPTTAGAAPAPTTAPEPTAPPTGPAKVGDRVEQNGTALTVVKVEKKAELSQFQKAKEGNTYVVAEVLIENVGKEKIPYNFFYFGLKDSDGFEYNATIGGENSLKSGDLPPGDKVRGIVAFEVKEAAKALVLSYKPLVIGADDPIRVALE